MSKICKQLFFLVFLVTAFMAPSVGEEIWYSRIQPEVSDVEEDGFHLRCRLSADPVSAQDAMFKAFEYYFVSVDSISKVEEKYEIKSTPVDFTDEGVTTTFLLRIKMEQVSEDQVALDIHADFSHDLTQEGPAEPGSLVRSFLIYTVLSLRDGQQASSGKPEFEIDENPDIEAIAQGLLSADKAVKEKSLIQASSASYNTDDKDVTPIRKALLKMVETESTLEARERAARILFLFFGSQKTQVSDLQMLRPLLVHSEKKVLESIWDVFGSEKNRSLLTSELKDELFSLLEHDNRAVRLEALEWLVSDPALRGEPRDEFARKAESAVWKGLESSDALYRQYCLNAALARYDEQPERVLKVLSNFLQDDEQANRLLAMSFLAYRCARDKRLHSLKPQLVERFKKLISDMEEPEPLYLTRAIYLMGGTDEVETYLQELARDSDRLVRTVLIKMARSRGSEGRPLLSSVIEASNLEDWLHQIPVLQAVGLKREHVPELLTFLERGLELIKKSPDSFDLRFLTSNLLVVLAKSELAEQERTKMLLKSYLEIQSTDSQLAAIYASSQLFPSSDLAGSAAQKLSQIDWRETLINPEHAVLAAYNLKKQSLLIPFEANLTHLNHKPVLDWLNSTEKVGTRAPLFVEEFSQKRVYEDDELSGLNHEMLLMRLRWLKTHPHSEAAPGLEVLVLNPNTEISELAEKVLKKLK